MSSYIALDVGEVRIGVAVANSIARLPYPHTTLAHNQTIYQQIADIIKNEDATVVVVGLPRNLSGDDTAQTAYVRDFAAKISHDTVVFQDEALTSHKAEAELKARKKPYEKGDVDALAATYILEDYLQTEKETH